MRVCGGASIERAEEASQTACHLATRRSRAAALRRGSKVGASSDRCCGYRIGRRGEPDHEEEDVLEAGNGGWTGVVVRGVVGTGGGVGSGDAGEIAQLGGEH